MSIKGAAERGQGTRGGSASVRQTDQALSLVMLSRFDLSCEGSREAAASIPQSLLAGFRGPSTPWVLRLAKQPLRS